MSSRRGAASGQFLGTNREAQRGRVGRPPAERPRKATRVYLSEQQRLHWNSLTEELSVLGAARIDMADLIIWYLERTLAGISEGLTGTGQVLPVGVTDLASLYFLLDLRPPTGDAKQFTITMFMESREVLSVATIRLQSVFRATWSQVFGLGIELLFHELANTRGQLRVIDEMDSWEELKNYLVEHQQPQFNIR